MIHMDGLSLISIIAGVVLLTFLIRAWWETSHDTKPRDPYRR